MMILNNNLKLGQITKKTSFLGNQISLSDILGTKCSFYRLLVRFLRLYEQDAGILHWVKYACLWIKWARSGVSRIFEKLKLKTIKILQTTFKVQLPLQSICISGLID